MYTLEKIFHESAKSKNVCFKITNCYSCHQSALHSVPYKYSSSCHHDRGIGIYRHNRGYKTVHYSYLQSALSNQCSEFCSSRTPHAKTKIHSLYTLSENPVVLAGGRQNCGRTRFARVHQFFYHSVRRDASFQPLLSIQVRSLSYYEPRLGPRPRDLLGASLPRPPLHGALPLPLLRLNELRPLDSPRPLPPVWRLPLEESP